MVTLYLKLHCYADLSVRVDAAGAADVEGAEAEPAVDLEVVVDRPLGRAEYPV